MDEHTFKKRAEMRRPLSLSGTSNIFQEARERARIEESLRMFNLFPVVQQYNLSAMKRLVTFSVVQQYNLIECHETKRNISCGTAVCVQLEYPEISCGTIFLMYYTIAHSVLWYCSMTFIILHWY